MGSVHCFDAKASYVVDYQKEDGAISFTIDDTADQDYKVQLKQTGVTLENGHYYKLTFKAKSSIDREIRGIMQGVKPLSIQYILVKTLCQLVISIRNTQSTSRWMRQQTMMHLSASAWEWLMADELQKSIRYVLMIFH